MMMVMFLHFLRILLKVLYKVLEDFVFQFFFSNPIK